jgi:hypothetical protein
MSPINSQSSTAPACSGVAARAHSSPFSGSVSSRISPAERTFSLAASDSSHAPAFGYETDSDREDARNDALASLLVKVVEVLAPGHGPLRSVPAGHGQLQPGVVQNDASSL